MRAWSKSNYKRTSSKVKTSNLKIWDFVFWLWQGPEFDAYNWRIIEINKDGIFVIDWIRTKEEKLWNLAKINRYFVDSFKVKKRHVNI